MKRRDFLTRTSAAALAAAAAPVAAIAVGTQHELLKANEHVTLKAGGVYVLPEDEAVAISTLISCTYSGASEGGPVILSKNSKIQGKEDQLTVDMQGTFILQYLGPDLGWTIA